MIFQGLFLRFSRKLKPDPLSVLCCRFVATGDSYRSIANIFCVGITTVSDIVPAVVSAIWDCLVEDFMAVPTTEIWRSIASMCC